MDKIFFISLFLAFNITFAGLEQTAPPDDANVAQDSVEYGIKPVRLAIIGSAVAASYTAIYLIYLKEGWWAEATPFHFKNDYEYASNLDKFGHFYTGVIFSELFTMSYDWVGMSPFASTLWAGITLGFTQILIEFKDGFSPYGYSVWDAVAGTLGGFYAMGKRFIPVMQYVDYKFVYWRNNREYWKMDGEDKGGSLTGGNGVWVDDYYGGNQTHWLSFKLGKMLPAATRDYYPAWLAFAFGWGIDDRRFDGSLPPEQRRSRYEFYFSPDYDLEAVFRPQKIWSKNLVTILNHIKFPAPAVRLYPNAKFFPLHPWYGFSVNL
jgi:hypothetical protein